MRLLLDVDLNEKQYAACLEVAKINCMDNVEEVLAIIIRHSLDIIAEDLEEE